MLCHITHLCCFVRSLGEISLTDEFSRTAYTVKISLCESHDVHFYLLFMWCELSSLKVWVNFHQDMWEVLWRCIVKVKMLKIKKRKKRYNTKLSLRSYRFPPASPGGGGWLGEGACA